MGEDLRRPCGDWWGRVGLLSLFFLLALRPIESFDTFWQLQSGKYIWQTGRFLYQDTFSLAGDAFRLEHCWLHDLVLYLLYRAGGYGLLGLLKPFVISLCAFMLLQRSRHQGVPGFLALPVLLLCLLASVDSWLVRPQLWTFLFGVLYLQILYRGLEHDRRNWLWLIPLMLLWANLHAACIFGFALFGAFWVGTAWRAIRGRMPGRDVGFLSLVGGLLFAAAFFNPYGWKIPLSQLLGHVNQVKVITGSAPLGMLGNMEWLPPSFSQVPLFYLVMALWGLTLVVRIFRKRLAVAELVYFLGFSYMGFSQVRHTTLVSMMAAFFLPLAAAEAFPALTRCGRAAARFALAAGLALLIGIVAWSGYQGRLGVGLKAEQYPVGAAGFLLEHRPAGNLYNAYDWGGYLMWRLFPDYRVFIDGRSTSPHYFRSMVRVDNSLEGWREILDHENVNVVLTRTCFFDTGGPINLVGSLIRDSAWALVYQDDVAVVFVHRDDENRDLIQRFGMPGERAYRTLLAEAQRLQRQDSGRPRVAVALARAYFGLGRNAEALAYYQDYLRRNPEDREASSMVDHLRRSL